MNKKHCWIFDDDRMDRNRLVSRLEGILPEFTVKAFAQFYPDLDVLKTVKEEELPKVVFFDAYQEGYSSYKDEKGFLEYTDFMRWASQKFPSYQPPHVVFVSRDIGLSHKCKKHAERKFDQSTKTRFSAIYRGDLFFVKELAAKEKTAYATFRKRIRGNSYVECPFFEVANDLMGQDYLPVSEEEIMAYILREHLMDLDGVLECYEQNKTSLKDAALRVAEQKTVGKIKSFFGKVKRKLNLNDPIIDDVNHLRFQQMQGDFQQGVAVFSWERVAEVSAKGMNPVLIVDRILPEDYSKIGLLKGLIVLENRSPAHLSHQVSSQGVTCFVGGLKFSTSFGIDPESGNKIFSATKWNGYSVKIKENQPVTMDVSGNLPGLYDAYIPSNRIMSDPKACVLIDLYRGAAYELSFPAVSFHANLDSLGQLFKLFREEIDGLGLVRTEHLFLQDKVAMQALKRQLLGADYDTLCDDIRDHHKHVSKKLLEWAAEKNAGSDRPFPVTMRLLDVLPEDLFGVDAIPDTIQEDFRGCQMGLCLPYLYEDQIHSVLDYYGDFLFERYIQAGKQIPTVLKLLVPTVRTIEEVERIHKIVEDRATRNDLPLESYQFGIMLETKDILAHMKDVAPHIDFMNIGSNDLTSELLGIGRSDHEARMKHVEAFGYDPFKHLHPDVVQEIVGAVETVREINPQVKICLCGDHALDQQSFEALYPLHIESLSLPPGDENFIGRRADYAFYDLRMRFGKDSHSKLIP